MRKYAHFFKDYDGFTAIVGIKFKNDQNSYSVENVIQKNELVMKFEKNKRT